MAPEADVETPEKLAKGTVCGVWHGRRGACYFQSEPLKFFRDVVAPAELVALIKTAANA